MTSASVAGNPASVQFLAQTGYWYEVQATTDLVNWTSIWQSDVFSSVALLLYTFGAMLLANAALDHSQPVAERVVVRRKHTEIHFSRGNVSWSHHLDLRAWSVQPDGSTIEVLKPLYGTRSAPAIPFASISVTEDWASAGMSS